MWSRYTRKMHEVVIQTGKQSHYELQNKKAQNFTLHNYRSSWESCEGLGGKWEDQSHQSVYLRSLTHSAAETGLQRKGSWGDVGAVLGEAVGLPPAEWAWCRCWPNYQQPRKRPRCRARETMVKVELTNTSASPTASNHRILQKLVIVAYPNPLLANFNPLTHREGTVI